MARLLLNMRMVPDDEADDVRAFLAGHAIQFHETLPSRWGISYGGIWVSNDADYPRARQLMDDYQARRQSMAREARALELREGRAQTLADVARAEPLRMAATAVGIVLLLALVALPVLLL
jgi:hypothetical protein